MTYTAEATEEVTPDPVEAKARDMGWKPEADWDGDADRWVPAGEFVEMKDRQLTRANMAAQNEIKALKNKIEGFETTIKQYVEHRSKAEERQYKRALKEIESRMERAVEDGDKDAYKAAQGEAKELHQDAVEASKRPAKAENPDEDPNFQAWVADNEWYVTDVRMRNRANNLAQDIAAVTGKTGLEFYKEVTKVVKEEFPEKFSNARRNGAAAVEDAGGAAPAKRGGKAGKDLPPEAKETGKRFVADGLYKNLDEYAKDYFDDE